jgi:hypothetical protein
MLNSNILGQQNYVNRIESICEMILKKENVYTTENNIWSMDSSSSESNKYVYSDRGKYLIYANTWFFTDITLTAIVDYYFYIKTLVKVIATTKINSEIVKQLVYYKGSETFYVQSPGNIFLEPKEYLKRAKYLLKYKTNRNKYFSGKFI